MKQDNSFDPLLSPLSEEEQIGRIAAMSGPLLAWYRRHGRSLPWRENAGEAGPYHVWLSEIMLQQTRVEAVIPYYRRFLDAVPDIPSLAAADDQLLHKLWEGLGYYSRVRNLKKGAIQVMERYGGQLPADIGLLRSICGIGDYTAGAIGSIAFGIREPAVDGNLLRVTARLLAAEGDIGRPAVKKAFHDRLLAGMPDFPGDFNQAMMDLGAGICLPGAPHCERCPIARHCLAFDREQQTLFPVKEKKKERRVEEKTVLVLISGDRVLLRQRPESGLLAGLWEFPMEDRFCSTEEIRARFSLQQILPLQNARHLFTHIEWQMKGFLLVCETLPEGTPVSLQQLLEEYPLASAQRVYRKAAVEWLGQGVI